MKYLLYGVVAAALIASASWYYSTKMKKAPESDTSQTSAPDTKKEVTTETGSTSSGAVIPGTKIIGNYYQYSDSGYTAAKAAHRPIFLYFYANWCPTCAQQEPVVQELMGEISDAKKLDDLVAFRVNFNDSDTDNAEEALAREFGVTYQHTMFVLDEDGNQYQKFLGQTSKDTLKNAFGDVAGI
ncbi:MAG: thioredoxin family protein [Patescibacteria group bacterium]